jgi:hypothetical protein
VGDLAAPAGPALPQLLPAVAARLILRLSQLRERRVTGCRRPLRSMRRDEIATRRHGDRVSLTDKGSLRFIASGGERVAAGGSVARKSTIAVPGQAGRRLRLSSVARLA